MTDRRAALYLRISQDATGEGLGVDRQQQDCRELAARLGWEVVEVFTDNDISAYKKRPGYETMLEAIETGAINAVIAWAPDRIYRRITDLEHLIKIIEAHGVQVATVKAGELDLGSAYGRMIARILGSIANGEGEIKAERWKRSNEQRRELGLRLRTGTRMFGYTKACPPGCGTQHTHETRDGEIVDHEAAIARVMAAKIREGGSILGLARWLDEQGVRATRGSAWSPQGIKRYLTNPRIAGWSTLDGKIVGEGQWEPIIDRETFEIVRALLTARTRAHIPRKALLLGLIHCGVCGHKMITSRSGQGARQYRCPARPNMPGCGRLSGKAEPIEEYIEAAAREALSDPRIRERVTELRTHPTELVAELAALDTRLIELEQQLDKPGASVDSIDRAIRRAKDRHTELSGRLATAGTATTIPTNGEWPTDLERRRALIDLIVDKITLLPRRDGWPNSRGFDYRRLDVTRREIAEPA